MSVLMGGSGSTGSSLVKNILNRSKDLFSGAELAFYSKNEVYTNWDKYANRINKRGVRGLRNFGYHLYNGTDLNDEANLNSESDIRQMIQDSQSIEHFSKLFFQKALEHNNAKIWMEKTPANSACFSYFLDSFENGKVIHMVRNPYDTIASLVSRGFDPFYATGIYLLNTASGLSMSERKDRYHEIKYEAVIGKSASTIKTACDFLDIQFDDNMLMSQGEQITDSQLKGWNHDETGNIGRSSIGRFENLSDEERSIIMTAINSIRISPKGKRYYRVDVNSIEEICDQLGYAYHQTSNSNYIDDLKRMQKKDRLSRIKRGYPTGVYYPLTILK